MSDDGILMSSSPTTNSKLEAVRGFWQRRPCGSKHADAAPGTPEFFAEVEQSRDRLEPFIDRYARFESTAGQRVLEIGTGLGTDFVKFARAGARVTGVDLTEAAISSVKARLALEGLSNAELLVANAEALPFDDASFDVVYSWGVLHHTPDTPRAVSEAIRVLRPGGRLCIMLYARRSWVAFGLWGRYALAVGRPDRSLTDVIATRMESPGTTAYTKRELRELFSGIRDLHIHQQSTPYDRRVGGPLAILTGSALGWFAIVDGRKPFA